MKKIIFTLAASLLIVSNMQAQNAKNASIEYNKVVQPCVMVDYNVPADMVEGALREKMSNAKLGSGSKAKDGFRMWKGITMTDIAAEKMDYYFRIDDKKGTSTLYMMTSKGYDNFLKPETDAAPVQNEIKFLDGFQTDAKIFMLTKESGKQEDVIKQSEKKAKNELGDAEDLQEDRAKLESKIAQNAIEAEAMKKESESMVLVYEEVKKKTGTVEELNAIKKEVSKAESTSKKAAKNYNNALKDGVNLKDDLAKVDTKIADNKTSQANTKLQVEADKKKLADLMESIQALRK
jgi:hypothetical protein